MQLREARSSAINRLTKAAIAHPSRDAELLLMFALGRDRSYLFSHPEHSLTESEAARYDEAISKRSLGMPPQYITGHQEFWGMDFMISPAVLIPRPETEHLVETVLELARDMDRPRIVDVGTGSGCIALALAKELPNAELHAVDVSPEALEVARENARRHHLGQRVDFRCSNLLDAFPQQHSFDFVVSNPPYISDSEKNQLQTEVRYFEPHLALFAGPSGYEAIEKLVQQAANVLQPGGWLAMEIGAGQETKLRQFLSSWRQVHFTNDLRGIPRVVAARRI